MFVDSGRLKNGEKPEVAADSSRAAPAAISWSNKSRGKIHMFPLHLTAVFVRKQPQMKAAKPDTDRADKEEIHTTSEQYYRKEKYSLPYNTNIT